MGKLAELPVPRGLSLKEIPVQKTFSLVVYDDNGTTTSLGIFNLDLDTINGVRVPSDEWWQNMKNYRS